MSILIRVGIFKAKRYISNKIILNRRFWGGILILFLSGILFYSIGSIFQSPSLKSYFRLLISIQATFLSIIVAILMATVSSSPYTRVTKYVLKKRLIVWKIIGFFAFSLLLNIIFFIGSDELEVLITLIPFRQTSIVSNMRTQLELLPTVMASTGIALSLSFYYLLTVRGILFSEEKAIADSFRLLIVGWFPREQIDGNVRRSNTPLGHFCRFIGESIRFDDNYALDAAIGSFEDTTLEFLDFHSKLRMKKIGYSDGLLVPTIEKVCEGWENIAIIIVEKEHSYALRVLMNSQYEIVKEVLSDVGDTMGGQQIQHDIFEKYFKIIAHEFANEMYYDEIIYGMIGDPENRLLYKWHLDALFEEALETDDKETISDWLTHFGREIEKRQIESGIIIGISSLVASWGKKFIKDNSDVLVNDLSQRTDPHWIYLSIERCLTTFGKKIYESDPPEITHWLVLIVSICDIASKNPTIGTSHQSKEDISWIISRMSEIVGQLQYSIGAGEDEFAELLALLMHLSDKESIELGLDYIPRSPNGHPYKTSNRSPVISFNDDQMSITDRSFPDLLEKADKFYEDISVPEDELEDRIIELLVEDIRTTITRRFNEEDSTEALYGS